jgi:hypothetical protein
MVNTSNHSRFLNGNLKSKKSMEWGFPGNPRILYPAKLLFKIDGAIKVFHNKQKLKQYMNTKPPLQKIFQWLLHTEDESKENHERTDSTKPQEKKDKESESNIDSVAHNQTLKKQKQLNDRNHHIPININTQCQCTELPHQNTLLHDRNHNIPINVNTQCQCSQLPHQKTLFSKLD